MRKPPKGLYILSSSENRVPGPVTQTEGQILEGADGTEGARVGGGCGILKT